MKEHYISFWDNGITAAQVFNWCSANLTEHQWKFHSKNAVMGAPVIIKGNTPTFKHPRRGDVISHGGIIFYHTVDVLAFRLAFNIKEETHG